MKNFDVSNMDVEHLKIIRQSVEDFIAKYLLHARKPRLRVLEVAPPPQGPLALPFIDVRHHTLDTFDIDPQTPCTYHGDLCLFNDCLKSNYYDAVLCTEVLEHVYDPFRAVSELFRILKPRGIVLVTVPFNFRIHGPLPDYWRFTEHGLRRLFSKFDEIDLQTIDTPDRPLMPIHYRLKARKPGS